MQPQQSQPWWACFYRPRTHSSNEVVPFQKPAAGKTPHDHASDNKAVSQDTDSLGGANSNAKTRRRVAQLMHLRPGSPSSTGGSPRESSSFNSSNLSSATAGACSSSQTSHECSTTSHLHSKPQAGHVTAQIQSPSHTGASNGNTSTKGVHSSVPAGTTVPFTHPSPNLPNSDLLAPAHTRPAQGGGIGTQPLVRRSLLTALPKASRRASLPRISATTLAAAVRGAVQQRAPGQASSLLHRNILVSAAPVPSAASQGYSVGANEKSVVGMESVQTGARRPVVRPPRMSVRTLLRSRKEQALWERRNRERLRAGQSPEPMLPTPNTLLHTKAPPAAMPHSSGPPAATQDPSYLQANQVNGGHGLQHHQQQEQQQSHQQQQHHELQHQQQQQHQHQHSTPRRSLRAGGNSLAGVQRGRISGVGKRLYFIRRPTPVLQIRDPSAAVHAGTTVTSASSHADGTHAGNDQPTFQHHPSTGVPVSSLTNNLGPTIVWITNNSAENSATGGPLLSVGATGNKRGRDGAVPAVEVSSDLVSHQSYNQHHQQQQHQQQQVLRRSSGAAAGHGARGRKESVAARRVRLERWYSALRGRLRGASALLPVAQSPDLTLAEREAAFDYQAAHQGDGSCQATLVGHVKHSHYAGVDMGTQPASDAAAISRSPMPNTPSQLSTSQVDRGGKKAPSAETAGALPSRLLGAGAVSRMCVSFAGLPSDGAPTENQHEGVAQSHAGDPGTSGSNSPASLGQQSAIPVLPRRSRTMGGYPRSDQQQQHGLVVPDISPPLVQQVWRAGQVQQQQQAGCSSAACEQQAASDGDSANNAKHLAPTSPARLVMGVTGNSPQKFLFKQRVTSPGGAQQQYSCGAQQYCSQALSMSASTAGATTVPPSVKSVVISEVSGGGSASTSTAVFGDGGTSGAPCSTSGSHGWVQQAYSVSHTWRSHHGGHSNGRISMGAACNDLAHAHGVPDSSRNIEVSGEGQRHQGVGGEAGSGSSDDGSGDEWEEGDVEWSDGDLKSNTPGIAGGGTSTAGTAGWASGPAPLPAALCPAPDGGSPAFSNNPPSPGALGHGSASQPTPEDVEGLDAVSSMHAATSILSTVSCAGVSARCSGSSSTGGQGRGSLVVRVRAPRSSHQRSSRLRGALLWPSLRDYDRGQGPPLADHEGGSTAAAHLTSAAGGQASRPTHGGSSAGAAAGQQELHIQQGVVVAAGTCASSLLASSSTRGATNAVVASAHKASSSDAGSREAGSGCAMGASSADAPGINTSAVTNTGGGPHSEGNVINTEGGPNTGGGSISNPAIGSDGVNTSGGIKRVRKATGLGRPRNPRRSKLRVRTSSCQASGGDEGSSVIARLSTLVPGGVGAQGSIAPGLMVPSQFAEEVVAATKRQGWRQASPWLQDATRKAALKIHTRKKSAPRIRWREADGSVVGAEDTEKGLRTQADLRQHYLHRATDSPSPLPPSTTLSSMSHRTLTLSPPADARLHLPLSLGYTSQQGYPAPQAAAGPASLPSSPRAPHNTLNLVQGSLSARQAGALSQPVGPTVVLSQFGGPAVSQPQPGGPTVLPSQPGVPLSLRGDAPATSPKVSSQFGGPPSPRLVMGSSAPAPAAAAAPAAPAVAPLQARVVVGSSVPSTTSPRANAQQQQRQQQVMLANAAQLRRL